MCAVLFGAVRCVVLCMQYAHCVLPFVVHAMHWCECVQCTQMYSGQFHLHCMLSNWCGFSMGCVYTHTHTKRYAAYITYIRDGPKCLIYRKWHIDSNQWHGNFLREIHFAKIECIHAYTAHHLNLLLHRLILHSTYIIVFEKINNHNTLALDAWTNIDAVGHRRCSCHIETILNTDGDAG